MLFSFDHFYLPSFTFTAGAGKRYFLGAAVTSQACIPKRIVADLVDCTRLLYAFARHFEECKVIVNWCVQIFGHKEITDAKAHDYAQFLLSSTLLADQNVFFKTFLW